MKTTKAAFLPLFALLATTALGQGTNSFENGLTGWTVSNPGDAVIQTAATGEAQFPSNGDQYCELTSGFSGDATPGYGPHPTGTGVGPDGTAGTGDGFVSKISRVVNVPAGDNCNVSIDWTFFQSEGDDDATYNDFLSIDVLDNATGALIANLVFVDTGVLGGTPAYTNVAGASNGDPIYVTSPSSAELEVAPAGFKRASVNIGSLTTPGQQVRVEISVGNVTDAAVDCRALVDNLRITGDDNYNSVGLRILNSRHLDGETSNGFDGGAEYSTGRFRRRVVPSESLVFRASGPNNQGGGAWALLFGQPFRGAPDFGFGGFSLDVPTVSAVFDGINPPDAAEAILGSLVDGQNFIQAAVPSNVNPGVLGFQGIMTDPTNPPFNIRSTAMTELEFALETQRPVGVTEVLDAGGGTFSDDDFGAVDLTTMGGFPFYGTNYTECFVGSNGFITFASGDTDFSESVGEFFSDQPRIAPLWDDFNPSLGGIIESSVANGVATISWTGLRKFGSANVIEGNSFSVQLFADGTITFYYGSHTSQGGLVGISPGNIDLANIPLGFPLAEGAGTDFSRSSVQGGSRGSQFAGEPIWQIFETDFLSAGQDGVDYNDMITASINSPPRLTFIPDGAGGYEYFTGTN